jgi:hypothetical protein
VQVGVEPEQLTHPSLQAGRLGSAAQVARHTLVIAGQNERHGQEQQLLDFHTQAWLGHPLVVVCKLRNERRGHNPRLQSSAQPTTDAPNLGEAPANVGDKLSTPNPRKQPKPCQSSKSLFFGSMLWKATMRYTPAPIITNAAANQEAAPPKSTHSCAPLQAMSLTQAVLAALQQTSSTV